MLFANRQESLRMGLWRFFLAFLLICHVLLPLSVSAEEENKSTNTTCPQNFHCGNLTNQLGFPFFNSSHPSNCGLFMLNCEAAPVPQITFDFLHGPWFSVVNISDPVIKLRYDDFEQLRSTGICNIFHYDDKHLRKTFPSFSYSILHNITLYGCTRNPSTSQRLTDDIFRGYQIYNKCDDDVIIYYQNPGHPAPGKLDVNGTIHAGCKNITLAMVWEDDYSSKTDLFELLTPEFDLEWHLSGNCSTCYSEGLECRVDWSLPGDLRCAHSRKGEELLN